jgi:hypothetical protein
MSMQWHPIFAQLLRLRVERYFEMRTTMPVGDSPRLADIVLLRRTSRTPSPFRGLWRHLTSWNLLEYKGPSVSPRLTDLELLVELGLGIERRLTDELSSKTTRHQKPEQMSFWYLANQLGKRFIERTEAKLGGLEAITAGLWRGRVLSRLVFLTSAVDLAVEKDALPLHIVGQEPPNRERDVAQLVTEQAANIQAVYGGWMATLHPAAWKEVESMARTERRPFKIDIMPAIEHLGVKYVIDQVGVDRVIEAVGPKAILKHISVNDLLAGLTSEQRRELKQQLQ